MYMYWKTDSSYVFMHSACLVKNSCLEVQLW